MSVAESEVIKTPQNQVLEQLDGADSFRHPYKLDTSSIETRSTVLHEMLHVSESEKILHFEYIVIKPVGLASADTSQMKTHSFNTGHIVNAGILYVMESG